MLASILAYPDYGVALARIKELLDRTRICIQTELTITNAGIICRSVCLNIRS